MYVTPEQIQATTKANMEALLSLATNQFAAFEKFASQLRPAVLGQLIRSNILVREIGRRLNGFALNHC